MVIGEPARPFIYQSWKDKDLMDKAAGVTEMLWVQAA